jgi:hypothetical protein
MIEIKVIHLGSSRIKKIRDALDYASSGEFFKTIPLADIVRDISSYMSRISPARRTRRYTTGGNIPPPFNSWVVKRTTDGNRVFITLDNRLNFMNFGGRAGIAKFTAVESGTEASTWTAKRTFRFKFGPGKKQWATVAEGSDWEHGATPAANVLPKTSDYIQEVLIPRISSRVEEIIERRFDA